MEQDQVQEASADFFIPIAVAYMVVCATWIVMKWIAGNHWRGETAPESKRPWLDFGLVFVAAVGVFAIGQLYRNDWLLPGVEGRMNQVISSINLCIPYLPIFLILVIRKQPLSTVWLSGRSLHWKFATGVVSAIFGLLVFAALRGDLSTLGKIGPRLLQPHSWVHAPAVFLEAVAVAFVFVRLRWICHPALAILIPSVLFALAHVPGSIEEGRAIWEIVAFFLFNTALPAAIFTVVAISKDVIWIAIPHFLLDIAIDAF